MCTFVCVPVCLHIWKIYLVFLMYSLIFKISPTSTYLQGNFFSVEAVRNSNELVFSTGRVGQFSHILDVGASFHQVTEPHHLQCRDLAGLFSQSPEELVLRDVLLLQQQEMFLFHAISNYLNSIR